MGASPLRRIDILRLIVRMKRFYLITRDLHLYFGLFISPFVLLFAISVIFLVHAWIPGMSNQTASRTATDLSIPADSIF